MLGTQSHLELQTKTPAIAASDISAKERTGKDIRGSQNVFNAEASGGRLQSLKRLDNLSLLPNVQNIVLALLVS